MRLLRGAGRVALGAPLLWCVAGAALAPEIPWPTAVVALLIAGGAAWRPAWTLPVLAGLAPGAALLAAAPARAAELLAWAFLAGWLLAVRRPLAPAGWPRGIVMPALLYGACVLASYGSLTLGTAVGIDRLMLPAHILGELSPAFLVFGSPFTPAWTTLQALTGVGLFVAGLAVVRTDARAAARVAWAIAIAMAVLALVGYADLLRQWSQYDGAMPFLARYARGERFSLHLADLNAAGSQYALAGGVLALMLIAGSARAAGTALLATMLPALWLTGSRTAGVALVAGVAAVAAVRRWPGWRPSRAQVAAAALVLALGGATAGALMVARGGAPGSAARSLRLRTQFAQTSAGMIAAAPVFGVGVGEYFRRSAEFMPEELRALYGAENAHNYFAQQFAELGIVGGTLFLWLVLAGAWQCARGLTRGSFDVAATALAAGCLAYLVTCVTGHPLLVAEAAFPFWLAFAAAVAPAPDSTRGGRTWIAAIVLVLLAANVAAGARRYQLAEMMPPSTGLDRADVAADGTPFRWSAPYVIAYAPPGPGFVRLVLRAPDRALTRPVEVVLTVAGRRVETLTLPQGEWVTREFPVRQPASGPFRRIDLRVRPTWTEKRLFGSRSTPIDVALGVMVAELRWMAAETH